MLPTAGGVAQGQAVIAIEGDYHGMKSYYQTQIHVTHDLGQVDQYGTREGAMSEWEKKNRR